MSRIKIKQVKGQTQGSILFIGDNNSISEDFNKINWDSTTDIFTVSNLKLTEGSEDGYILMSDNNGLASWTQSNIATQSITEITLTGDQDGSNKDFTLVHELTYPNNLFFINGQLLTSPNDYTIDGFTLSLDESTQAPLPDDILRLFGSINEINGAGILALNSLSTTEQFLTATSSVGNVNLEINSSSSTHEFDANINFNDGGTASTDVWSANQTINYIQSVTLEGGRSAISANNIYLRNSDNLPFNTTPFILPYDGKIKSISISTSEDSTWTGEVRNNGSLITGASIVAATSSSEFNEYDINVDAGSQLQLYCNGEAVNPKMVVTIIKR